MADTNEIGLINRTISNKVIMKTNFATYRVYDGIISLSLKQSGFRAHARAGSANKSIVLNVHVQWSESAVSETKQSAFDEQPQEHVEREYHD